MSDFVKMREEELDFYPPVVVKVSGYYQVTYNGGRVKLTYLGEDSEAGHVVAQSSTGVSDDEK